MSSEELSTSNFLYLTDGAWSCSVCERTFEHKSRLERHLKSGRHASLSELIAVQGGDTIVPGASQIQNDATVAEASQIHDDTTGSLPAISYPMVEVGEVWCT